MAIPIPTLVSFENSDWGYVVVPFNKKEWVLPYCLSTREVFNLDPVALIRFKCVLLTAATPLVTLVRIIYEVAKAAFLALAAIYYYLDNQPSSRSIVACLITGLTESGRTSWYGIRLTGYSFMGIFDPYRGRQRYGKLERELNRHSDGPHSDKFYLAFCFQRIAHVPEDYSEYSEFFISKLHKHIAPIDGVIQAIANAFSEFCTALHVMDPK